MNNQTGFKGDYADFFIRIKEMAKEKNMSDKETKELLANRDHGEKVYERWLLK